VFVFAEGDADESFEYDFVLFLQGALLLLLVVRD
jgi:hypothetical protein